MSVDWPTVVLAGLEGSGKTEAWRALWGAHGYPKDRLIEAHVVPVARELGEHEMMLPDLAGLATIREAHPVFVLVWMEAPKPLRVLRRGGPVMDQAYGYEPWSIRSVSHQLVYNTGSRAALAQAMGEVRTRCQVGRYIRLAVGAKLDPLGTVPVTGRVARQSAAKQIIIGTNEDGEAFL